MRSTPDHSDHDGEGYEYDHYDYRNYDGHTATHPEHLQSDGEQDFDLPQSRECSSENNNYDEDYNAGSGDIYDCHNEANYMSKPHEMVAFMCYRSISNRILHKITKEKMPVMLILIFRAVNFSNVLTEM